jgi:hypothetical protein
MHMVENAANPVEPECVSLIVCDAVYTDGLTGKQVLVGTFQHVRCPSLPARLGAISVHFVLTDGEGTYETDVELVCEEGEKTIIGIGGPMQLSNRHDLSPFWLEIRNVALPRYGKYWVMLKINGKLVRQYPFHVVRLPLGVRQENHDAPDQGE